MLKCISDGTVRWRFEGKVRDVKSLGDLIIVLSEELVCLDASTGEKLWSRRGVDLVDADGGKVCAVSGSRVECLNPEGSVRWTYDLPSRAISLSISDDLIYLLCEDGFLYCLRETEDLPKPGGLFRPQPPEEETVFEGSWVPSELI